MASINRIVTVKPDEVHTFAVPLDYLPGDATSITGRGIEITSDHPISVSTSQHWNGNGESTIHLPVFAWGRSYTVMSMFQDRYGMQGTGYSDRPGQIVVIAQNDSTEVTIIPTVDLEAGPGADDHPRGVARTYTLQRGQTLYTTAAIIPGKHRDYSTDLTGTSIRSSKPIAVISGHTKGAFLRMPDAIPPTGRFATGAHFVRSNIHEVMLPDMSAGTLFTTVVLRYTPTRVRLGSLVPDMDDDRGDVIRVVALHNNTTVLRSPMSGGSMTLVAQLDSGESYLDTAVQESYVWESSHPVLMMQYGKSFAKIIMGLKSGSSTDEVVMGHPTFECGMPHMQLVPPMDRWIQRAVFQRVEGMDNFIGLTFRMIDTAAITFDGRPLSATFGNKVRRIGETDYGTLSSMVPSGTHVIASTDPSVRWMGWAYGSLDGLQQGHAFGTPLGIGHAMPYDDRVSITSVLSCSDVSGTITITRDERSVIAYVEVLDTTNVIWDQLDSSFAGRRSIHFRVPRRSLDAPGSFRIRAVSTSGRFVERQFVFEPVGQVTASQSQIDVGELSSYDERIDTIQITTSTPEPVAAALSLAWGASVKIVSDPNVTVSATSPATVVLASRGVKPGAIVDTLIAATEFCGGGMRVCTIRGRYVAPSFNVSAPSFTNVARDREHIDTAVITYNGSARVALLSVRAAAIAGDTSVFTCTTLDGTPFRDALPMVLDSGNVVRLLVRFRASGDTRSHETSYRITTSDVTVPITMRIRATIGDTTTSVEGVDHSNRCFITVAPSPVIDDAQVSITAHHGGPCAISVMDMTGRVVGTFDVVLPADHAVVVPIPFISTLPSGVYTISATLGTLAASTSLHIVR
jgi:hypothetical protein